MKGRLKGFLGRLRRRFRWPRGRYNGQRIVGFEVKLQLDVSQWLWRPMFLRFCNGAHLFCFRSWWHPVYADDPQRWQFAWRVGDGEYEYEVFGARSLEEACDRMLDVVSSAEGQVRIDHEAMALHARPGSREYFPVDELDHPISEYV